MKRAALHPHQRVVLDPVPTEPPLGSRPQGGLVGRGHVHELRRPIPGVGQAEHTGRLEMELVVGDGPDVVHADDDIDGLTQVLVPGQIERPIAAAQDQRITRSVEDHTISNDSSGRMNLSSKKPLK
jgi:hypothetical protein